MNYRNFYLYRDPYQISYGFYFNLEPNVWLKFGVRLGKYDIYFSKTGPKLDYVREHFDRVIARAKRDAKDCRENMKIYQHQKEQLETVLAYETRL